MKIIIEAFEGKDFPTIQNYKRLEFEKKLKQSVKDKLQLRDKDEIVLNLKYQIRQGAVILQETYEV